jgi:hypothetical protein
MAQEQERGKNRPARLGFQAAGCIGKVFFFFFLFVSKLFKEI